MNRRTLLMPVVVLLAGCSMGPTLGPDQVNPWPLTVGAGTVTCERGISAAKIGLKVDGRHYALSMNAWADQKNYTRIASVFNGDQAALVKLVEASRTACDVKYSGPADYEAAGIAQP